MVHYRKFGSHLPVQAHERTHSELETKQTHCIELPATSSPQSILQAAVPDKNCQSCAKHVLTEHGRAQPAVLTGLGLWPCSADAEKPPGVKWVPNAEGEQ